jgi:hypothetical protein
VNLRPSHTRDMTDANAMRLNLALDIEELQDFDAVHACKALWLNGSGHNGRSAHLRPAPVTIWTSAESQFKTAAESVWTSAESQFETAAKSVWTSAGSPFEIAAESVWTSAGSQFETAAESVWLSAGS